METFERTYRQYLSGLQQIDFVRRADGLHLGLDSDRISPAGW